MRRLLTGTDAQGRSCVVEDAEFEPSSVGPGVALAALLRSPADRGPRPTGHAELRDLGIAPGEVSWLLVEFEPNADFGMHHTDTVDLAVLLTGTVELVLDDGAHLLSAGESVVVAGVDHGWRSGPQGCRFITVGIGTPPP